MEEVSGVNSFWNSARNENSTVTVKALPALCKLCKQAPYLFKCLLVMKILPNNKRLPGNQVVPNKNKHPIK